MLYDALRLCLDVVQPKRCAGCESAIREGLFCPPCDGSLIPGEEGACPQCGAQDIELDPHRPQGLCGPCIQSPPAFARAMGAYAYGGSLADAIRRWKNRPDPYLSGAMSQLFVEHGWESSWTDEPSKLIFVPPDPRRLRRRGFHPAGLLARALGRTLGAPIDAQAVRATSTYPSSKGQSRIERRKRLRGIFSVERRRVQDQRLLLVDDVMTTGATADAIARACLKAKARSVEVIVLARAPR